MNLRPIIAGNWKMHKTPTEGASFVETTVNLLLDIQHVSVIFAPPFTGLFDMDLTPPFYSAAQNCHWEEKGAFTGEISVSMIQECGAEFVILGHSERRHVFGESDDWINRKVKAVLAGDLKPILCVGETLDQREAGQTELVLKSQLEQGLASMDSLKEIVIAYEPVWAIGTGEVATPEDAQEVCAAIREHVRSTLGDEAADGVRVLYGGSVKAANVAGIMAKDDVDGALVGGAAGGLLGNRIAGRGNRMAGTLIGAGAGLATAVGRGQASRDEAIALLGQFIAPLIDASG